MKIQIIALSNHLTYGGMRQRLEWGFKQIGHETVEGSSDVVLVIGQSALWNDVKQYGVPVYLWCHGVDIGNFESANNKKLRTVYDNCAGVAYQSTFARNMTWRAFGEKKGSIIFNAGIPNFGSIYPICLPGGRIDVATTAIWRAWKRLPETERLVREANDQGRNIHLWVGGKEGDSGSPFIHYMGMLHDFEHYHKCHFYLQLSFCDYSPGTVGEALAMGLPVLTVNSGGAKEIVDGAGIALDNDPIPEGSINVNDERNIPKINTDNFWRGFNQMTREAYEFYRNKVIERVTTVANAEYSARQFIDLFNGLE